MMDMETTDGSIIADFTGTQKAAILLIALGPEKSSAIFKHLKEDEIEELTLEIANTRSVTPQIKEAVIEEFYGICLAQQYIAEGGINYAKELLEKALGEDKAMDVISKLAGRRVRRRPCRLQRGPRSQRPRPSPGSQCLPRCCRQPSCR